MRPPSNIELDDPTVVHEEVDQLIEEILLAVELSNQQHWRHDPTDHVFDPQIADRMIVEATDFSPYARAQIIHRAYEKWQKERA